MTSARKDEDEDDTQPFARKGQLRRQGPLAPSPSLWAALRQGEKLRRILEDFYECVWEDTRLAPFFRSTTKEWVIDHQYAFLAQIIAEVPGYFGDRPRNAHHWMVIDDELFDYREVLLESVLRRHGLADEHIARWRAIDEAFRPHIVKDKPFARVRNGIRMPLDGEEAVVLVAGGLCDDCQGVVDRGEEVQVHVRTGHTRCRRCAERVSDHA